MKKLYLLVFILVLGIGSVCLGATTPAPRSQAGQDNQEMRKNLAWLTEGLKNLDQSNDRKLKLTADQKKKIRPIFEDLVKNNLVLLTAPPERQQNQNQNQSQNQQRGQFDPNDPKVQARMKRMKEQTDYGNKQADLVDVILSGAQKSYIDNMNFVPEKYGFLDFRKVFGNFQQGQRPDQKTMDDFRSKMKAGQTELIKLNNEVLKMLKS
jgi:hypothetical protein